MLSKALNFRHAPGLLGLAARAYVAAYTAAVVAAVRLRGVRAVAVAPGQVAILGPRTGRGQAVWADYIGLLARDARARAAAADAAAAYWARRFAEADAAAHRP